VGVTASCSAVMEIFMNKLLSIIAYEIRIRRSSLCPFYTCLSVGPDGYIVDIIVMKITSLLSVSSL